MKLSKIITACFCFTLLLMSTQCDDDDVVNVPCDQTAIVDSGFYESVESHVYEVGDVYFNDNCLTIEISASGCDGNSWSMVLVDSGNIAESSPEQRYLKFVLNNDEVCLAIVSQVRSFDLTPIQVAGSSEIILNIEGFPEPVMYSY
ncbi:hypothetical protein [Psychroserpens luteus]|uniref:Lipocalin-like domain-containing protein n=1 Tax=Psychroserpens luteus TaxID=1434066 RepID=A0ABW5ZXL2_9FLAO|nr:hypothetical protein [Psychroserpens luteus]